MKQKALQIFSVSVLLGLTFDWFFYGKIPGVSVFLYTALVLGFVGSFVWQFKHAVNKALYWLVPVTLFFSFMVLVRANPFLAFVDICMTIYLLMLVARLSQQPNLDIKQSEISQYFGLAWTMPIMVLHRA